MSKPHLRGQAASSAGYGGFAVIRGIDLEVRARPHRRSSGPNGAGKTTLLKALAGPPAARAAACCSTVTPLPVAATPRPRAPAAWRWSPKGRQLFPQMTVTENLELGG